MKPIVIGAFEAKTHLSEYLDKVAEGQTYVISKRGHPIAELKPLTVKEQRPQFGCDKGRIVIKSNFNEDLPDMSEYQK
jgi:prevent-host-death family protein